MKLPTCYVVLVSVLAVVLAVAGGRGAAMATEEDIEVDLELALAIDVSGGIDDDEAILQRAGYIAAFRHPRVLEAIRRAGLGRIAVATRFKDFASAILRKLILEIAGNTPEKAPDAATSSMSRPAAAMGPPCDYGERLRDSFDVDDM